MDIRIELTAPGGVENLKIAPCESLPPGPGEIRIRQQAVGVNYIDIYHRTGLYPLPLPAILGVEGVGVVEAVGEGAQNLRAGDRVVWAGVPGGYAAVRSLPAWKAVKLPDDMEATNIAGAFLRGLTAHMLLTRTFRAQSGATLLVHAAAGGLGAIVARWAKRLGCSVIGTAGSREKAEIALGAGVDNVIVGRDADIVAEVGRLTGGAGVDFVVDGVGGEMLRKSLACAGKFGTVASIGQPAGPIPAIAVEEIGPGRSLSLARPSVMAYAADREIYAAAAVAVIEAVGRGVSPKPVHAYPLAEAARAHSDLEAGRTTGGLMLIV